MLPSPPAVTDAPGPGPVAGPPQPTPPPVDRDRPSVPQVRGQVPAEAARRSTGMGVLAFLVAGLLYGAAFYGTLAAPWWPLQMACAVLAGLFIGTWFITGHDACHGSLTPHDGLNQALGRVALLPAWTPFVTWHYAHNRIHHSYTNLREKDYAWAPFSKEEYDRLPWLRRVLERHYRSVWGLGTYYLVEYWLKHLLFLPAAERRDMKRPITFALDALLVAAFAALQVAAVLAWSAAAVPAEGWWGTVSAPGPLLALALLVPFAVWNWGMGFAIFQHHNHPRVAWYGDREEWDFFAGQVESTVHVQMPRLLEWLSAHIMQHTAHHVNPKIPLYRLTAAQRLLEQAYPEGIVAERWTLRGFGQVLGRCKLYDYANHRWLNFRGKPTTEPHPALRAYREIRGR